MAGTISATTGTTTPAALNTPLQMTSITEHGVYMLEVDLANLANTEDVNFTVTNGAGVTRSLGAFSDDQVPAGQALGPIVVYPAEAAVSIKVEQTAGTLRAFPWVLKRVYDDTVSG
jgi:hypothetical protein